MAAEKANRGTGPVNTVSKWYRPVILVAVFILLAVGFFNAPAQGWNSGIVLRLAVFALFFLLGVHRFAGLFPVGEYRFIERAEAALFAVLALNALLRMTGGAGGDLFSLNYLVLIVIAPVVGIDAVLISAAAMALIVLGSLIGLQPPGVAVGSMGGRLVLLAATCAAAWLVVRGRRASRRRVLDLLKKTPQIDSIPQQTQSGDQEAAPEPSEAGPRFELPTEEEIVFKVLDLARRGLRSHTCAFFEIADGGKTLALRSASSESLQLDYEKPLKLVGGLFEKVVREKRHLILPEQGGEFKSPPYYSTRERLGSLVAVPIVRDDRVFGVLCADSESENAYDREDVRFLKLASDHLLRYLDLADSLDESRSEIRALSLSCEAVGFLQRKHASKESVVEDLAEWSRRISSADWLLLCLKAGDVGLVRFALGLERAELVGKEFPLDEGIAGKIMVEGRRLQAGSHRERESMIPDGKKLPLLSRQLKVKEPPSLLCLPLTEDGITRGVILLGRDIEHGFGSAIVRAMESVAAAGAAFLEAGDSANR